MSLAVYTARSQLGYHEGRRNDNKFGRLFGLNHVSWCAIFVWWVYLRAYGVDLRKTLTSGAASVDALWRAGRSRGMNTTHPTPGDIVIFHFPGEHAGGNHTGIFVADAGDSIVTIEGNTGANNTNGGGVLQRSRRKSLVLGYLHVVDDEDHRPVPVPVPPEVQPTPKANAAFDLLRLAIAAAKRTTLTRGNRGDGVRLMQHGINKAPTHFGHQLILLAEDGDFGQRTEDALKVFQQTRGLHPDGVCGPATWNALYP